MKRIFTLLFLIPLTSAIGQIEGTWKLAAEAGALAVGPSLGNLTWFQSTAADVNTRACLFDDEYVFNADGTFENILGETHGLKVGKVLQKVVEPQLLRTMDLVHSLGQRQRALSL